MTPAGISALANLPVKSVYSVRSIILKLLPTFEIMIAESRSSYSLFRSMTAVRSSSSGMPVLWDISDIFRPSALENSAASAARLGSNSDHRLGDPPSGRILDRPRGPLRLDLDVDLP